MKPGILAIRPRGIDEAKNSIFKKYKLLKLTEKFLPFLQKISANSQDIVLCKICIYFYVLNTEKIINLDFTDFICNLFVIPILYVNFTHFICNLKNLICAKRLYTFLCRICRVYLHFVCNHLQCSANWLVTLKQLC